jgi:hypothetical protein
MTPLDLLDYVRVSTKTELSTQLAVRGIHQIDDQLGTTFVFVSGLVEHHLAIHMGTEPTPAAPFGIQFYLWKAPRIGFTAHELTAPLWEMFAWWAGSVFEGPRAQMDAQVSHVVSVALAQALGNP